MQIFKRLVDKFICVWYNNLYTLILLKNHMKKEKELYTAPALRLLPLQLETGLCASGDWGTGDLPGFEFEDGDD